MIKWIVIVSIKDLDGDVAILYYYLVDTEINTDSIPRGNF